MEFHVVIPVLISFAISLVLGPIVIPFLRRLKMGQTERELGVQSHLKKNGTPTMGGVIFLIATTVTSLFYIRDYPMIIPVLFLTLGFGLIGFLDDYDSCNQSFIQIGARLGKEAFCDYFAAFGLRAPTGIDLPAEPKKSLYYTADRMGPVELASCAFGQSSKISYLEMASAVCAVVNGGRLMQPYVVSDILGPEGEVIDHLSPVCKRQVLKEETSRTMREMMEAVVLYGGGRNAQIAGYRVGGKSGTSQKLDSADEKARIASFVAVAPIDDPQFLCLVCLDEPHSWTTAGGSLSAPVCAEVLEQTLVYKGVPRAAVPDAPASDAETSADLPEDGDSFDGA